MTTDSDIPVIDFGPFLDHSNNNSNNEGEEFRSRRREETAEEIRRACLDHGFFYATHHGIDPALLDAVWEQTESLFDLSPSQKSEISSKHDPLFRGYISTEDGLHSCNSKLRDELGVDDQKESYTIGATESGDDKASKAGKSPMHGPNQWPKSSDLPSFRTTMEAYWEAQIVFSRVLARGIALSLGLPPGFFDPHLTDPVAQMVLLRYPSPPSNTMTTGGGTEAETAKACRTKHPGCGEHTDCGFLTILAQTHPGLEVRDRTTNQWKAVKPLEGAFVVNLGDMAARWTNGTYRSTEHRVYNTTNATRYSIPFFCNCNFDAPVECIVEPRNNGEHGVARYEATTAGAYILERLGLMRLIE